MDVSYGYILWIYLMIPYLMDVSWPVQYEPNPNFGCQYFVYLAQVLVHHHTMHSSFFGDLLHLLWRAFLKTCLEQMSSQPLPFGSAHKIDIALPGCWARAGSETPPALARPLTPCNPEVPTVVQLLKPLLNTPPSILSDGIELGHLPQKTHILTTLNDLNESIDQIGRLNRW